MIPTKRRQNVSTLLLTIVLYVHFTVHVTAVVLAMMRLRQVRLSPHDALSVSIRRHHHSHHHTA
jgi:hypothetical protein